MYLPSLERRSAGLTPACHRLALYAKTSENFPRLGETLARPFLKNTYSGRCGELGAPSVGHSYRSAPCRRCVSPGGTLWITAPVAMSPRRPTDRPTTPACVQLMTRCHHLMLPSRHVGKTTITAECQNTLWPIDLKKRTHKKM